MELHQLRCFAAAAQRLHFRQAAEALHVSQSSLSEAIQRLEVELRTPLFHRAGRRVTLTEAGRALLPVAERMLACEEEARQTVAEVRGLKRGRLSLCALPALDQYLLPPLLARFRQLHPEIDLRIRELRPAGAVAEAVRAGEADLGFLHLPAETRGLEVRELLREPLLLVVPASHALAGAGSLELAAAAREDFVWVHEAQDEEHPLYAACLRAGFRPHIVCESGSAQGVLALVAAGLGCTLLPRLAAEERPGIARLHLTDEGAARTLAVVWDPERLSLAGSAFLALMRPGVGTWEGSHTTDQP